MVMTLKLYRRLFVAGSLHTILVIIVVKLVAFAVDDVYIKMLNN